MTFHAESTCTECGGTGKYQGLHVLQQCLGCIAIRDKRADDTLDDAMPMDTPDDAAPLDWWAEVLKDLKEADPEVLALAARAAAVSEETAKLTPEEWASMLVSDGAGDP